MYPQDPNQPGGVQAPMPGNTGYGNTQPQPHTTPSFSQVTPPQPQQQYTQPIQQPVVTHETNTHVSPSFVNKIEQLFALFYVFVAALLLFRFGLGLFGAQRAPFVDFVFDISTPFMIPFSGMFGASPSVGYYTLEFEVLIAIAVYAIVFLGLGRLVKILFR